MITLMLMICMLAIIVMGFGIPFGIADMFEKELKQVKKPDPKPILLWTAEDDAREKALYLENTKAFWLNPNRYGADGTYDLCAEPYHPPVVKLDPPVRQLYNEEQENKKVYLGNWEYQTKKPMRPTPPKTQKMYM